MQKMEVERENFQAESDEIHKTEDAATETFSSDLTAKIWSVVSFDKREVRHLTYEEAEQKIQAMIALKVSGLCIITDEAAERINNQTASEF